MKTIQCRTCNKIVKREHGDPEPEGWYNVTQNREDSHRGYVWVGKFCSVICLDDALSWIGELESVENETQT